MLYSIRLAKQQLFTCSTLFGISRSLSGYHTFLYRNYPRTPTTLSVLISRFIDEGERYLEILEKEILSRHGSFISKSYNLGHTDFPLPLVEMLMCVQKKAWSLSVCRKQHRTGESDFFSQSCRFGNSFFSSRRFVQDYSLHKSRV